MPAITVMAVTASHTADARHETDASTGPNKELSAARRTTVSEKTGGALPSPQPPSSPQRFLRRIAT